MGTRYEHGQEKEETEGVISPGRACLLRAISDVMAGVVPIYLP
jgi:hypothetical protein